MKGENPFQPVLAKPIDDTVLNNDPAADNFLAGNDRFGRSLDGLTANAQARRYGPVRLDQMTEANPLASLNNDSGAGSLGVRPISSTSGTSVASDTLVASASRGAKAKTGGMFSGLGRGRARTAKPTTAAGITGATMPNNSGAGGDMMSNTIAQALGEANQSSQVSQTSQSDRSQANLTDAATTAAPTSPISSALASAAAISDSKSTLASNTKTSNVANNSKARQTKPAKSPAPAGTGGKQLTISTMTIIFVVLFVIAAGVAVYFGLQNKKNADALADSQAKVAELTDTDNSAKSSTNKSTTQLSALQDKVQDLTKKTEDNQKTIDDLNKKNNDLTKSNQDLTTQLKAANDKLASDKTMSDNVSKLLTTLCANSAFSSSEACQSAASGVAAQAQNQTQAQ